jgi:hypothetical protein
MRVIFTVGHITIFYKIAREAARTRTEQSDTWNNIARAPERKHKGYVSFDDIQMLERTIDQHGIAHVNIDTIKAWAQSLKLKRLKRLKK